MSNNIHKILDTIGPFEFAKQPTLCPRCGFIGFEGIEIIGTCDGPLLWKCSTCEEHYLRFSKRVTEEFLDKLEELWVDLDESFWENICQELPN